MKQQISKKKYEECRLDFKKEIDRTLIKEILTFTGWNLFGMIAALFVGQLRGIFLNFFFGVKLNAAEGLGKQVNAAINKLSTGITKAITPQLNKSEGAGNREYVLKITNTGIKYTTLMFALVAIPFILECRYFLSLWLGEVPIYTVIFCQIILLQQLVDKFTWQIGNAIRAVGIIRNYQLAEGCLFLLGIPIGWSVLYISGKPISIFIVELIIFFLVSGIRIFYGKKIVGLDISIFIKSTICPILFPMLLAFALAYIVHLLPIEDVARVFAVFSVFVGVFSLLFYCWGMSKEEKFFLRNMIVNCVLRK